MPAFEESREYRNLTAIWAVMSIIFAGILVFASVNHKWLQAVQASVCLLPLALG